jgi:cell division cycle 20, cofactor of APC complex
MDDYYLNLLSWGKNNTIAVALNQSVYLWEAATGQINELVTLEEDDDYVSSVQWSERDNTIAVGTHGNVVLLYDAARMTKIRELRGHSARVGSLAWNNGPSSGGNLLSSGGRDSLIINHDIRQANNIVNTFIAHQQEVCGLAWSPEGSTLASGGNENLMCLWDLSMSGPVNRGARLQAHNRQVRLCLILHLDGIV